MKLDDLNKKNVFKVPEGYFDDLPMKIQSRIQKEDQKRGTVWDAYFLPSLKYTLPILILAIMASIFLLRNNSMDMSPDSILAEVETSEIIAYLEYTDISTEELIEGIQWQEDDFESLAEESFSLDDFDLNEGDYDLLLDEFGLEDELL